MGHYVSFRTNRFATTTVKPHFINPETGFGEDVVTWLRQNVQHPDIVLESPIQEDYGWGIWANVRGTPYWIAASLVDKGDETHLPEWGVTVVYERGCNPFRRLPPTRKEDLLLLSRTIDDVLHADPAITEIQWWREGFEQGQPTAHPE